MEDYAEHWRESYVTQMEAFVRSVRAGEAPETDGWVGTQALAVVEALQAAAEKHAPQPVATVRSPSHSPRP